MAETLSFHTIDRLAKELHEPSWLTELRRKALAAYGTLAWAHASDEVWRRTAVALLDPMQGCAPTEPVLLQRIALTEPELAEWVKPLGDEQLFVRANGSRVTDSPPRGLVIEDFQRAAHTNPTAIQQAIEADGLSEAEQKLTSLNGAFHHDDVFVHVPAGTIHSVPVRLVRLCSTSAKQAIFPLTVIVVGAGSSITLIDEYVDVGDAAHTQTTGSSHVVNARIELVVEPDARVHYVRLQRWDAHAREFLLQRAVLGSGAVLTAANITLGGSISKAHVVTKLAGEHASAKLCGFVFGRGRQHVDQHTLQDHQAPHTYSDLQYRAALQDESRMIYTGLIRIARAAAQTQAFQANHNLLLSQAARAETIPMLEILADDVQCKHGASVGPIDEEQTFYLMSRGVPWEAAQRLLVMGFIEPIMQELPFEPLRQRLRQEIEGGLHR